MVKPWLFEFFRSPAEDGVLVPRARAGVTAAEVQAHFATYMKRWTRAEAHGYEGIFFSEHHFGPGYSPSPNLLIAALAPLTKTLRLGVMGVVLPYYNPWRVIEEIGMLDHLTNGRLEVGTASGIPPEMAQVGLGVAEANERNAEAQALLDLALANPMQPITHHGKYWNFDNLTLVPAPLQFPINRWTTVVSEASARRSAQRGTRICSGFNSVAQIGKVFASYREEAAKKGIETSAELFGIRRNVTMSRDRGEALAASAKLQDQIQNIFLKMDDKVNHGPVPDAPQKSHGGLEMSTDEYIAGTPKEVADQIIDQCRTLGAGHFLAIFSGSNSAAEDAQFDLFGQEVVPLLRRAGVDKAA